MRETPLHLRSAAASEFVECVTDDLLGQSVFVFTPSGEVVRLPKVRR
jgi:(p)ppGpp synthase/HD superfamily hydrolase